MGLFIALKMDTENTLGCVYFVKLNGLTPIKIGYSTHPTPRERVESFSTCAPFGVELVGFIQSEHAIKLERTLHEKFSAFRLNGEWFEISKEQARSVCEAMMSDYQKDQLSIAYELVSKGIRIVRDKVVVEKQPYPVEFDSWCHSSLVVGIRMDKSELYSDLIKNEVLPLGYISQKRMTNWICLWAKKNGFALVDGKSGYVRWILMNYDN